MTQAKIAKVRLPKMTDIVADDIRQQILDGRLKNGDKLPSQNQLVEQYNVSRPTLREAFRLLEADKLITTIRGSKGGAIVNAPDPGLIHTHSLMVWRASDTTIDDILVVRGLVEPAVVYELTLAGGREPAKILRECMKNEYESIGDSVLFAKAVSKFHRSIILLLGNHPLIHLMEAVNTLLAKHLPIALEDIKKKMTEEEFIANVKSSLESQEILLSLMERNDAVSAMTHWRMFMRNSHKNWVENIGGLSVHDLLGA